MKIRRVFLNSTVNVRGSRINELHSGAGNHPEQGVGLEGDSTGNVWAKWIHQGPGNKPAQVTVYIPSSNVAGIEYEAEPRVSVKCAKCSASLNGEPPEAMHCAPCTKAGKK